jgi:hypothetical protein
MKLIIERLFNALPVEVATHSTAPNVIKVDAASESNAVR